MPRLDFAAHRKDTFPVAYAIIAVFYQHRFKELAEALGKFGTIRTRIVRLRFFVTLRPHHVVVVEPGKKQTPGR